MAKRSVYIEPPDTTKKYTREKNMVGITPNDNSHQKPGNSAGLKKSKEVTTNSGTVKEVEGKPLLKDSLHDRERPPDSPVSKKTIKPCYQPQVSTSESIDSGIDVISEDDERSIQIQTHFSALENLADSVLSANSNFNTALFFGGLGKEQQKQVNDLTNLISEKFYTGSSLSLSNLLENIKENDSQNPKAPTRHSFLLRSAILQASEENGAGIQSWEAFTHPTPLKPQDDNFWPWLEQPHSWIPEAQGAAAKYMEHAWITALELARQHPEQQVVAYKGGFGAGKTSHGKSAFGEQFAGAVAPDSAKKVVRKALPVSHATTHIQGSNIAFKLFDGLINMKIAGQKNRSMGTIIYDSSLSTANDVIRLIEKSQTAGKPLKVIDITRDDKARSLAVLARKIEGEDPRIPLEFIETGAARDRKQRSDCMNAILTSQTLAVTDPKTGNEKIITHTYEFHCGDAEGSDRQLICTLKSGQPPLWNEKLEPAAIDDRLASQGITFNTKTGRFEPLFPGEQWQSKLRTSLKQPVKTLVEGLSSGEAHIRKDTFGQRVLPLTKKPEPLTPKSLYTALNPMIRSVLSVEAFISSFEPLTDDEQQGVLKQFQESYSSSNPVSYMDLPAVMAIELHRAFRRTPECWPHERT